MFFVIVFPCAMMRQDTKVFTTKTEDAAELEVEEAQKEGLIAYYVHEAEMADIIAQADAARRAYYEAEMASCLPRIAKYLN